MFHMWKLIKCWFKSKLKGGSSVGRTNMHSVLTHTHTHIHTHNPFCAPHTQKKKQFLKNSTFSTILDVTRHFGLDTRVWVNHILLSSHLCACLVISVFSLFRCLLLHREHFFFFFFLLDFRWYQEAQRWLTTHWKLSKHVGGRHVGLYSTSEVHKITKNHTLQSQQRGSKPVDFTVFCPKLKI